VRFRVLAGLSGVSLLGDFAWCVSALGRLRRPSGVSPPVYARRRVRVVCPHSRYPLCLCRPQWCVPAGPAGVSPPVQPPAGWSGVSPSCGCVACGVSLPWGDSGACSFLGVSCVVRRIVAGGCRECRAGRGFPFAGTAAVCCGAVLFRCGCFVILGRLRVAVRSGLGRVFFDGRSRERVW